MGEFLTSTNSYFQTGADETLELDIDSISTPVLWKIYELITRYLPHVEENIRANMEPAEAPRVAARPAVKKKSKPMSRAEQERSLAHIEGQMNSLKKTASQSQEPIMPSKSGQLPRSPFVQALT